MEQDSFSLEFMAKVALEALDGEESVEALAGRYSLTSEIGRAHV